MPGLPPLEVSLCKLCTAARLCHHLLPRLVALLLLVGGSRLLPVVLRPLCRLLLGPLSLGLGRRLVLLTAVCRLRLATKTESKVAVVALLPLLLLARFLPLRLGLCCRCCCRCHRCSSGRCIATEGVAFQLSSATTAATAAAATLALGCLLLLAAAQPVGPTSPSSATSVAVLVG